MYIKRELFMKWRILKMENREVRQEEQNDKQISLDIEMRAKSDKRLMGYPTACASLEKKE
jgi:hypothetical protein